MRGTIRATLIGAALVLVAACGGGGGASDMPVTPAFSSGKVDLAYGAAGKVTFGRASDAPAFSMAVDAEGNAYVSGAALTKIDPSGTVVQPYNGFVLSRELSPVTDAAGNVYSVTGFSGAFVVAKRDPIGSLALDYGQGGLARIPGRGGASAQLVGRDAVGNLYVMTFRGTTIGGPGNGEVLVVKLDATGHQVMDYGTTGDGHALIASSVRTNTLAPTVDENGSVFFASKAPSGALVITKLDANGRAATSFGQGGAASLSCGETAQPMITTDRSGNAYVAVSCIERVLPPYEVVVFKLDARGNRVASFGDNGKAQGLFTPSAQSGGDVPSSAVFALLADSDGSLYLAISTPGVTCAEGVAVIKLDSSGHRIAAFGASGTAMLGLRSDTSVSMAKDGSGRLYVGAGSLPTCQASSTSTTNTVYRLSG